MFSSSHAKHHFGISRAFLLSFIYPILLATPISASPDWQEAAVVVQGDAKAWGVSCAKLNALFLQGLDVTVDGCTELRISKTGANHTLSASIMALAHILVAHSRGDDFQH